MNKTPVVGVEEVKRIIPLTDRQAEKLKVNNITGVYISLKGNIPPLKIIKVPPPSAVMLLFI